MQSASAPPPSSTPTPDSSALESPAPIAHTPPRLLFPVQSLFPAQNGGPDNTVYWLTQALRRRGYAPMLVSGSIGLPPEIERGRWLSTDYGEVIYVDNPHFYFPINTVWRTLLKLPAADVLHLSLVSYPAAWGPALLNVVVGRSPVFWSVHGELDPPMLKRSPRKKRAVLAIIRTLLRIGHPKIYFHSTCPAETQYIRDNFGRGQTVIEIPNYMALPERVTDPTAVLSGSEELADIEGRFLLFIGRIDPKKGIDRLLDALVLSERFVASGAVLRVVGDASGPYGKTLRAHAARLGLDGRVEFAGHRAGHRKQAMLAAAEALVMPSQTENFGIVVTEALAQGTPAIASTGTPWRVLEEYGAGWWCDNTPEALAAAIDAVLSRSGDAVAAYRENALRLVRERFDIDAHVDEWDRAYRMIIDETIAANR